MSICKYCQQEMNGATGCVKMPVRTMDGLLDPVPYGQEQQHRKEPPLSGQHHHGVLIGDQAQCHDCDVLPGSYHHPGCDWEECPQCHEQLVGCECDPLAITSDEEEGIE